MKHIIPVLLVLSVFACQQKPTQEHLSKSQLIGTWTNLSLLVTMKKLNNKDSILEANQSNWGEVLHRAPITNQFLADSTMISQYSDMDGNIIETEYSKWWIRNDSLIVSLDGEESSYHFNINGNRIKFRALRDWDNDGVLDDYDVIQIKLDSAQLTK